MREIVLIDLSGKVCNTVNISNEIRFVIWRNRAFVQGFGGSNRGRFFEQVTLRID